MSRTYQVTWTIHVEADTPLEAAFLARQYQQDKDSIATVFTVADACNPQAPSLLIDTDIKGVIRI